MEKSDLVCESNVIHEDVIEKVSPMIPCPKEISNLANFFKVLGDDTRLKIISALLNAEMCVCDISYLLNMSQSLISHQLRVLRVARFVKFRRAGKVIYYSLDDEHIEMIVKFGILHLNERSEVDE